MNSLLESLVQNLNLRKQFLVLSLLVTVALVVSYFVHAIEVVAAFLVLNIATAMYLGFRTARRAEAIVGALQTMAAGNLSKKFGLNGKDDFAWMGYEYDSARKGTAKLIQTVRDTAGELNTAATEMSGISSRTKEAIASQGEHTHQIADSILHLAEQIKEVSQHASQVAASAREANTAAVNGSEVVGDTIHALEHISSDVQGIAESIGGLQEEINKISTVMQVIRDISEQTNLLALNAAIEAARAGEAGRGFAVVADEVRNLSQRTGKSTEEINQIITSLQTKAQQVSRTVREKQTEAATAAGNAKSADAALHGILTSVETIVGMSDTIATLTAQQESSAGGITEAVTYIEGLSQKNAEEANAFYGMSKSLSEKAESLNTLVSKFSV
ncbi:methyl-accepting chemotaxis protein [Novimethylophilus kurashikiensis]|uniref:Methyl-accepting chemotaxis protein n=1 Tax=Novimethylophilus kurashikiensis TaxID=1825523 RepID=A0A2R5FC75_9PROT|nr:methyl-accepting chemotaxis protein [Novimethylophilus kurashikiensis]GBG15449.1 methyl-accepting chemotaxis protein [Novimethylophilus kurashikiensis]